MVSGPPDGFDQNARDPIVSGPFMPDSIKTDGIPSGNLPIFTQTISKATATMFSTILKSILFCFLNKKIGPGPAHAQQNIFCFALLQESVFVHIYSICLKTKQKNSEYQQNLSITGSGQGIVSGKQTFRIYNAAAL